MTMPFFAVDSERWPRMLARLRSLGPLEEDEARTDLRYLENEHRVWRVTNGKRGAAFPGRRALETRWEWPERKVRALLAVDDWHDPHSPVPSAELRRSAPSVPATAPQTSPQASPQASPSPDVTTPVIAQICPADVPATAPQTSPSMSIARVSSRTTSTTEPLNHSRAREPATPKPDPARDLWGAYAALRAALPALPKPAPAGRGAVARPAEAPSPDSRKAMSRILAECGSPERARVYLEWVHTSGDRDARRLRGEAPWPDGAPRVLLDPESLSRHIPARMVEAEAWEARGRTDAARPALFSRPARPERVRDPIPEPGSDQQPWEGAIAFNDRCHDEWRAGIRKHPPGRRAR